MSSFRLSDNDEQNIDELAHRLAGIIEDDVVKEIEAQ
jgi:hypothetical protein